MTISRRTFLKTGILTSIVAGVTTKLSGLASAGEPIPRTDAMTLATPFDYYTKATFQSYINSDFRFYANRKTWLRLVLVEDFPTREALAAPDECFRLLFSAPAETFLPQGTYDVDHAALGSFALFIVPGNPVNRKRHYEAAFNRRSRGYAPPPAVPGPKTKASGKKSSAEEWDTNTATSRDSATKNSAVDTPSKGNPPFKSMH